MHYIRGFLIIVGFLFAGEVLSALTRVPVPGSVFGMLLLFLGLSLKRVDLKYLESLADFFLGNILLFFIPIGVSVYAVKDLLRTSWLPIGFIVISSTILVTAFTGALVQILAPDMRDMKKDP